MSSSSSKKRSRSQSSLLSFVSVSKKNAIENETEHTEIVEQCKMLSEADQKYSTPDAIPPAAEENLADLGLFVGSEKEKMSSQDSLFPYDKEELLRSLERFDGTVAAEDVTDSIKYDNSRYVHTSFIEVLLECICAGLVKNDGHREIVLAEICRRLAQSNFMNEELLLHTLPLRKELSKRFFDYIKKICGEVLPGEVFDFSTLSFLEDNSTSIRNVYRSCFEELQEIGRGGFGVVCKARNKMTDSLYAIKKIFFNYKNDSRLCRVIREAKNIAVLNHPNVVHYNNAWTEAPSPDDAFDYSSSDKDSDSSSTGDNPICQVSYCSEYGNKVEETESFSSESTYFRSVKSNQYHFSRLKKKEYTSYSKDSDFIIFSDFPNVSNSNVGSDIENHTNLNFTHEHYAEKRDVLDSVDKNDLKNSYVSHSNSNEDSEKSDDSINLNVKAILYIQMEYCDCDLRHWLEERAKGNPLPFEMDVTNIFINILNGVVHIHSKGVIHRDLKPQNIFYSKSSNTLKIGDFGLATLAGCPEDVPECSITCGNVHSANIGTLPYAAPEQIKGQSYDSKVDIYSLGIILIELLNNCSTVMELTETIKEVKKGNFPNNMKEVPKLINLVTNLVKENPDERMSAKEILSYLRDDPEITTIEEMKIALQEKEIQLRIRDAALNEKDEEIRKLKALINELQNLLSNQ